MEPGARLLERLKKILEENGIAHYLIAFRDPDSDTDRFADSGSVFWIFGAAALMARSTREEFSKRTEED